MVNQFYYELWIFMQNKVLKIFIYLGYKGNYIKKYFKNKKFGWRINLVETGKNYDGRKT